MSQVIRIDDEVWKELIKRAQPLVDGPNDVLRRVFGLPSGKSSNTVVKPEIEETRHSLKRIRKARLHPPVKDEYGTVLDQSIKSFADRHKPQIKYLSMRNALDVLTACQSLDGKAHDFHFEIIKYAPDGVYIRRVSGTGHRTSDEEMRRIMRLGKK